MPNVRVPNQKFITDTQKSTCDKEHLFAQINLDALNTAMMRLKGEHFKVWVYFAKNASGYSFYLSSKDVCENCCISRDTYDKAIAALIKTGYLVQEEEGKNNYYFTDMPPVA